jgi:hypothetical protein
MPLLKASGRWSGSAIVICVGPSLVEPPTRSNVAGHAGRITRLLALLRAHRIIRKISGTHGYLITDHGREVLTALLAARQASYSNY